MRLAAFDPRVRTLNGLRGLRLSAFDPRVRTLNGRALGCSCQDQKNLGRMRLAGRGMRGFARLGRLGQGDTYTDPTTGLTYETGGSLIEPTTPAEDLYLTTGAGPTGVFDESGNPVFNPSTIAQINAQNAAYTSPGTTAPIGVIANPTITPQQALAQQYYGTTNLTQLSPAQTAAINAAAPLNNTGGVLTAAQVAALQAARTPGANPAAGFLPGTNIPTSYLVYGLLGLIGVSALGSALSGGRRR